MKIKYSSWKNLRVCETGGGFGWQRFGDPSTQTIGNILDDLEDEMGELKRKLATLEDLSSKYAQELAYIRKNDPKWER